MRRTYAKSFGSADDPDACSERGHDVTRRFTTSAELDDDTATVWAEVELAGFREFARACWDEDERGVAVITMMRSGDDWLVDEWEFHEE